MPRHPYANRKIQAVGNALQLCLRSMTPGCAFNIAGFGSKYELLFRESRAASGDRDSVRKAWATALAAARRIAHR